MLIGNPETNEELEVFGGTVLYHGRGRDEFDRKVLEFKLDRFAVVYTGKPQEDMEFVL